MERPSRHIFRYLRNNGVLNAAVNGAVTPQTFSWSNTRNTDAHIHRMLILITDVGTFDSDLYGNGVVLTKGIPVYVRDAAGNVQYDLTDGNPIKTNAAWQGMCYDFNYNDIGTSTTNVGAIRWTFSASGYPLILRPGWSIEVVVQDDLSGLTEHDFMIQGIFV